MKLQPAHKEILGYLDRHGSVNTFRLSRELGIERAKLLDIVKALTKGELIELKSGKVAKIKKEQAGQKVSKKVEKAIILPKPAPSPPELPKKPQILKDNSGLEKTKRKIQKSEANWLEKEGKLKKEIKDLEAKRNSAAEKVAKEVRLVYQMQKERKKIEKNLMERENSLNQREDSVRKKEESVSAALKRLKREKARISKSRLLKKDIGNLEATLEDLKEKVSAEQRKPKKLKEKEIKLKATPKKIERLSSHQPTASGRTNLKEKQKSFDKSKIEEIKPILGPKIKKPKGKIRVSKTETEQPKITPKELWQPAVEIGKEKIEDKFHDLIEQEIDLLKQKRNDEARNIHLRITDMISEVADTGQRKTIIMDWNRIKEFY